MKRSRINHVAALFLALPLNTALILADTTINKDRKYAYSANGGWINFRPDQPKTPDGLVVGEYFLSGYVYASNYGWIHLGDGRPANGVSYQNDSADDCGVNHNGAGNLSGFAYGANIGWLKFDWGSSSHPDRPRIDLISGEFKGMVYGANIGWLNLGGELTSDTITCSDKDGDGIGDEWELSWFGDIASANATTDSDADGRRDAAEYTAHTNPKDERDYLDIVSHDLNTSTDEMEIEFTSSPSRLYILETCDNMLTPWGDAGLGVFSPDAGASTSKTISFTPGVVRKFIRVRPVKPLQP